MRGFYEASIWAPHAIPDAEWKYRNLKRVMFPVIDFLFVMAGLSAARYGVPAISEFFPEPTNDFFSYLLSLVATTCLIGVSFPKLWPLEIAGKSLLLGMMSGYVIALFMLTAVGEDSRGFVLLIALITLVPIGWRLSLLGTEWQARQLLKKGG